MTTRRRSEPVDEPVEEDAPVEAVEAEPEAVVQAPKKKKRVRVDADGMADGVYVGKSLAGGLVTIDDPD